MKRTMCLGILLVMMVLVVPVCSSGHTNDIEYPEEGGPYRLTVLFSKWSSSPDFIKISKGYITIGPLIWMSNNSLSMAYNCVSGYEIVLIDGVNQKTLLDNSVSRRVEGFGFKGFQIWPFIAVGRCDYIDIK